MQGQTVPMNMSNINIPKEQIYNGKKSRNASVESLSFSIFYRKNIKNLSNGDPASKDKEKEEVSKKALKLAEQGALINPFFLYESMNQLNVESPEIHHIEESGIPELGDDTKTILPMLQGVLAQVMSQDAKKEDTVKGTLSKALGAFQQMSDQKIEMRGVDSALLLMMNNSKTADEKSTPLMHDPMRPSASQNNIPSAEMVDITSSLGSIAKQTKDSGKFILNGVEKPSSLDGTTVPSIHEEERNDKDFYPTREDKSTKVNGDGMEGEGTSQENRSGDVKLSEEQKTPVGLSSMQGTIPIQSSFNHHPDSVGMKGNNVPAQSLFDQVTASLEQLRHNDRKEVTVDLRPDWLGRISIKITTEAGKMAVQILTDNLQVKEMLGAQIHHLNSALKTQQMDVARLDVSYYNTSQQQGFSENHSSQHQWERNDTGLKTAMTEGLEENKEENGPIKAADGMNRVNYFV